MEPEVLIPFIWLFFAIVLVGIVIAAVLVGCAILSVVILSTSTLAGFWQRSARFGVQMLLLQCGFIGGSVAGACLLWLASRISWEIGPDSAMLAIGASAGALIGLGVSWLASAAITRTATEIWPKLRTGANVVCRKVKGCAGKLLPA